MLTDDGTCWVNLGDSYYNYRPGKGQGLPKQSVANTKQDLPDVCPRREIESKDSKKKTLLESHGCSLSQCEQMDGI